MKLIGTILVLVALCMAGPASAQTTPTGEAACTPYKMPIQSTITSCGLGLIGSKFKTTTKVCPRGTITESSEYDTSGCNSAPSPAGTVNYTSRCALMPDSCAVAPVASNCPAGAHWTLLGSAIAHCVQDDFACAWGKTLVHDAMGNPSCLQNTCPSNQVLQGDGVSCGCPSGSPIWSGTMCTNPPITCATSSQAEAPTACPAGYSGTQYRTKTTTCPSGQYGSPAYGYSAYDTSACTPLVVSCVPGTATADTACGNGYVGLQFRNVTTSCPGGSYGSPAVTYSAFNTAQCGCANGATNYPSCTLSVTCVASSSTTSRSCGTNFSGTLFTTSTTSCPSGAYGSPSYGTTTDSSNCGCANGASNFPICSLPAPIPVAPLVCKTTTAGWSISPVTQKCSRFVTTCCNGVCTKSVDYGATAVRGICYLY